VIDRDLLDGPLALRVRRAGDRFRPEGGVGSRKLQDFFVDSKLPRELRATWPLLTSGETIVWVVGLRADRRFTPSEATRQRLWLQMKKV
jgi:tRNA(Ile)-lysidine synthase